MTAPNITELTDTLECHDMPIYTDANCSLLGITDATTLNELIEGGLVPINSIVKLWVNGNSAYGQEIRSALNTLYNKDVYGYLTIERNGPERHLTIKAYDTLDTFETTYTTTNDRGWFGTWLQTCGKPTKWYLTWNGVDVRILEYQEFFFVYLRGTLTSNIANATKLQLTSDVTFINSCVSPIQFSYGASGEFVIDSTGAYLQMASGAIANGSWICGQAFVYKLT